MAEGVDRDALLCSVIEKVLLWCEGCARCVFPDDILGVEGFFCNVVRERLRCESECEAALLLRRGLRLLVLLSSLQLAPAFPAFRLPRPTVMCTQSYFVRLYLYS